MGVPLFQIRPNKENKVAHDLIGKMMNEGKKGNKFNEVEETEEKGKGKISSISIRVSENGYTYNVSTEKGKSEDYVYKTVGEILEAVEDDLGSPHIRKSHKGLSSIKARKILNDKEVRGNPLTRKQRGYFGAMSK